jgi:hypothetical protein
MRVILNNSPTSCNVFGPLLASNIVQLFDSFKSIHIRHALLSHDILHFLCAAKHVILDIVSFICNFPISVSYNQLKYK